MKMCDRIYIYIQAACIKMVVWLQNTQVMAVTFYETCVGKQDPTHVQMVDLVFCQETALCAAVWQVCVWSSLWGTWLEEIGINP